MSEDMDLTKGPITKTLWGIAIPITIGLFFQTLFNFSDAFWAGKLSDSALAALGTTFPLFFVAIACATGLGTGLTAIIGHAIGAKDINAAKRYSEHGIGMGIYLSLALMIVGYITHDSIFRYIGLSPEAHQYATEYFTLVLLAVPFLVVQFMCNSILNAKGDSKSLGVVLVIGALLNLYFDPALLYGWGIFPQMGFTGLALSTTLVMVLGCIYMLYQARRTGLIGWNKALIVPDVKEYREISVQGLPSMLSMITIAAGSLVLTRFVAHFGDLAIAGFTTAVRIEQIALLPSIGVNIAVLSMVSQYSGAQLFGKIRKIISVALRTGNIVIGVLMIIMLLKGPYLLQLFSKDVVVLWYGLTYLLAATLIALFSMFNFVADAALRGLKFPNTSLTIGIIRQIILPIIIIPLLLYFHESIWSVWLGVGISVVLGAILSGVYTHKILKNLEKKNPS